MVFTVNLFSDGKRRLVVLFSLIVLIKVTVNGSQVVVTCRYVTIVESRDTRKSKGVRKGAKN